ncbi:MAG TPA: hypothetical protein VNJ07_13990 [Chitinophagales bacterium]|nr:hypothetical protein [Chitinophagales bacterium]
MKRICLFLSLIFYSVICFSQESPVQGDELLQCLGQPRNSELVSRLNDFIGNKDTKEDISFLNYGKGIQVNISESIVKSIDFYNDKNPYSTEFKRFPGRLPLDISFDNTIYQTKQKMGDGYETVGEAESTLQLIKIFRLNNDDDYRLTVEFNTGRMILLSLAYIEGGGGGVDSLGNETNDAMPGFGGNDFFTMIRKNKYNLEFTRFTDLLGFPTFENRTRRLYADKGVDIRFTPDGAIQSVTLYSGGQSCDYKGKTYQPYTLDLPYGMRMENSKSAIIKKLGTPLSDDGNVITYRERIASFHIAFKGDKINYVRIELAGRE